MKAWTWEMSVLPGGKTAAFAWEKGGNKPTWDVKQSGVVEREGNRWQMGCGGDPQFFSSWVFILSSLQLKLLNHSFLNKLTLKSRLEMSLYPAVLPGLRERGLNKRASAAPWDSFSFPSLWRQWSLPAAGIAAYLCTGTSTKNLARVPKNIMLTCWLREKRRKMLFPSNLPL